jgi:hypothetical protein
MFNNHSQEVHDFFMDLSSDLSKLPTSKNWFVLDSDLRKDYLVRYCKINDTFFVDAFVKNIYKRELISELVSFLDTSMSKVISLHDTLFSLFDHYIGVIVNDNLEYILMYAEKHIDGVNKLQELMNDLDKAL